VIRRRDPQPSRNTPPAGFGYPTVITVFTVFTVFTVPVAWALTALGSPGWVLNAIWATIVLGICGSMAYAVHLERIP
jgi:hypothetical protein